MVSEYADEYRELAEYCLAFAAAAWQIEAKAVWLKLASKWHRLAEEAEKNVGQPRRLGEHRAIVNRYAVAGFCVDSLAVMRKKWAAWSNVQSAAWPVAEIFPSRGPPRLCINGGGVQDAYV